MVGGIEFGNCSGAVGECWSPEKGFGERLGIVVVGKWEVAVGLPLFSFSFFWISFYSFIIFLCLIMVKLVQTQLRTMILGY